jgi:mannan endo-1,4-beta-mannosidase
MKQPKRITGARSPSFWIITFVLWCSALGPGTANAREETDFVKRQGTGFVLNGAPFNVAGINNHYLTFGSRQEVLRVLDDAVAMHANVVRTFIQPVIGSPEGAPVSTIWDWKSNSDASNLGAKGAYLIYWDASRQAIGFNENGNGFERLDFVVAEAQKRNLKLLIAFLDFWDYAGGAQQMRAWYGSDDTNTFFFSDPKCREDYRTVVSYVLTRRNTITGTVYQDDPAIFAWELMNEPNIKPESLYLSWVADMAAFVKSIDQNHLVAAGYGHDRMADIDIPSIDFGTWHGYPLYFNITNDQFNALINDLCEIGRKASKPVLLEEFGLARSDPDQSEVYRRWLTTIRDNHDCAGWLVWRLVSRQDSGNYPEDQHDQFDIHNDGGATWSVLKDEAALMRARSFTPPP